MPNAGIHLCIAKKISKQIKQNNYLYYIGNVAPDAWRNGNSNKRDSHFLNSEKREDYEDFYKKYLKDMDNPFVFGYLIHLMADNYWYSHGFLGESKDIKYCSEISKIVSNLTKRYDLYKLQLLDMNSFYNPVKELDKKGINKTLNYINNNCFKKVNKIDVSTELENIDETCSFILNELEELKKKYYKL